MSWITSAATPRVALSNNRICSVQNGEVSLAYRDRKKPHQRKLMKLDAQEFIRRFLLHVIPKGFMRVRHFGFLANNSKGRLSKCRQLLELGPALPKLAQKSVHQLMLELTGIDITRCPLCRKGTLVWHADLPVLPHGILRDARSTIKIPCPCAALCQSQSSGAPDLFVLPLLGPCSCRTCWPLDRTGPLQCGSFIR